MYPYNRAVNRSLRRKKSQQTDEETRSNMSASTTSDGLADGEVDIVWDPAEYKLTYVLENFKLPQIVRVVEGFMLTEDDCLASGTVLTIHGQQTIEQICGRGNDGTGRDIVIPLNCPYKVKVAVLDNEQIFKTVKDLCNYSPLPKCVMLRKKVNLSGIILPAGQCLNVNSITRNHVNEAFGILVSKADNELSSFVLPLKVEGNFSPCPFPRDQSRRYFIRELADRPCPIFVEFVQTSEKNSPFGPQIGIIKLTKLLSSNVVFATSIIDNENYAISFSRDLPVTIEVARGMLNNSATYVNKCKAAEAQIDIAVLSHLNESNPYANEFKSSIYADVMATRKAMQLNNSWNSFPFSSSDNRSIGSDVSFGEDPRSFIQEPRYIMTYKPSDFPSTTDDSSCSRNSQGEETPSFSSVDNVSLASFDSDGIAVQGDSPRSLVDSPKVTAVRLSTVSNSLEADFNSSGSWTDEKVVQWMDRPSQSKHQQSKTTDKPDSHDYAYPDWPVGALRRPLNTPPPITPRTLRSSLRGTPKAPPRPSSRNRNASTKSDPGTAESQSMSEYINNPGEFGHLGQFAAGIPETVDSETFAIASDKSDEMSVVSEYMSVRSENHSHESFSETSSDATSCEEIPNMLAACAAINCGVNHKKTQAIPAAVTSAANASIKIPPRPLPRPGKNTRDSVVATESQGNKEEEVLGPSRNFQGNGYASIERHVPGSKEKGFVEEETSDELIEHERSAPGKQDACVTVEQDGISLDNAADVIISGAVYPETEGNSNKSASKDSRISSCEDIRRETQEGVFLILEKLQLSEFGNIFQENQINGQLLTDISADDFVSDLGLSHFQAQKLMVYVRGWRPFETGVTGEDDIEYCSVNDVFIMMGSINLNNFASFCAGNQVDGILLREILQAETLQCLRDVHGVKLSKFEEKKLIRFVKGGWRPDHSIKR